MPSLLDSHIISNRARAERAADNAAEFIAEAAGINPLYVSTVIGQYPDDYIEDTGPPFGQYYPQEGVIQKLEWNDTTNQWDDLGVPTAATTYVQQLAGDTVESIADLRNEVPSGNETSAFGNSITRFVLGHGGRNDGGHGLYYWHSSSTVDDSNGHVIKPSSIDASDPGRWIRVIERGTINVLSFGVQDGVDSHQELQNIIDLYGKELANPDTREKITIEIPYNIDVHISQGITCPYNNLNFKIYGFLTYTGSSDEVALEIGSEDLICRAHHHIINVRRQTQSDWSSEENCGVRFITHYSSDIDIRTIEGFTVGMDCYAVNGAFSYNTVNLLDLDSNKIAILGRSVDHSVTGDRGWFNENNFRGGRIWVSSSINTDQDRYGVVIRADGSYIGNNGNLFTKLSFELSETGSGTAYAIRLQDRARKNRFLDIRNESNDYIASFEDDSYENIVRPAWSQGTSEALYNGDNCNNYILWNRKSQPEIINTEIWNSGDLVGKANYFDDIRLYIDGVSTKRVENTETLRRDAGLDIVDDYIEISSTKAIGTYVDTKDEKEFLFKIDAVSNADGGRYILICYDSNDNILTSGNDIVSESFKGMNFRSDYFGGCYRTGVDSSDPMMFRVKDTVDHIWIGVQGGAVPAKIKSMALYNRGLTVPRVYPGHGYKYDQGMVARSLEVGSYNFGDVVHAAWPQELGYAGWTCVESGEFGTAQEPVFEPFGIITLDLEWNTVKRTENFASISNYWDGQQVWIDGYGLLSTAGQVSPEDPGVDVFEEYIEIVSSRCVGFFVDTREAKEFCFRRHATAQANGGRIVLRLFDETDAVVNDPALLTVYGPNSFADTAEYSTSYRSSSDNDRPAYFIVDDTIEYMWIGIRGGNSANAQMQSILLQCKGEKIPRVWPGHGYGHTNGTNYRYNYNNTGNVPVAGIWKSGEIAYADNASAGGYIGAVCTSAGEFGTATEPVFRRFGAIEA